MISRNRSIFLRLKAAHSLVQLLEWRMLAGCLVYDLSPRLVHHAATVGGCAGEARRRWLLRLRPRLSVRLGTRPVPSRPTPARLRARAGLWCRYRKVLLCPGRSVCRGRQPSVECCWGGRSSVLAWSIRARVRLPSRVARFCGYGRGIVLRVWWSVCGCLCVPVGTMRSFVSRRVFLCLG